MDFRTALQKFGRDAKRKLQDAVPVATGRTRDSIHYKTTESTVTLYQRGGWFGALIEGRRPASKKDDRFVGELRMWMAAVGGAGGLAPTDKGAKALAYWINKEGTRLFQKEVTGSLEGINFDTEIKVLQDTLGSAVREAIKLDILKITKK